VVADVLNRESPPSVSWSRVSYAEAVPGVQSPLSWCVWDLSEASYRRAYTLLCLLPRAERTVVDDVQHRFAAPFYGRGAFNMDMFGWALSALPGATRVAAKQGYFASNATYTDIASAWRRAWVRVWIPLYMLGLPARLRALRARSAQRWNRGLAALEDADGAQARRVLREAIDGFIAEVAAQIALSTGIVSQLSAAVQSLARQAGKPDLALALVGGFGATEELGMTADLQKAAQGYLPLREFLQRHGFHGPLAGELSSHSWREQPELVTSLLRTLSSGAGASGREAAELEQHSGRAAAEAALLGALPLHRRVRARIIFACVRTFLPLRTTTRAAFAQTFDLIRAAARRLGKTLADSGVLERADDVFFLSVPELFELPVDPRATVAFRREKRAQYEKLDLPLTWTGTPVPIPLDDPTETRAQTLEARTISGSGVSPGIVEGAAQVFVDSSCLEEMQEGAILVCNTTDPSWAATMMLASGLVIDIGGLLSHGAIVARELGIPCVINTVNGTRRIRTGDRRRVDGDRGVVTILEPTP